MRGSDQWEGTVTWAGGEKEQAFSGKGRQIRWKQEGLLL